MGGRDKREGVVVLCCVVLCVCVLNNEGKYWHLVDCGRAKLVAGNARIVTQEKKGRK